MIIPRKITQGSHIRVIAPSRSMEFVDKNIRKLAQEKLEETGFRISFGKNVTECDIFDSSRTISRVDDLHEAFVDKDVDGIFSVIGGYSANQILKSIDYRLIKENPKIFCGFSDITVLHNALLRQVGLVTYYGPHFSSWGMKKGFQYSLEYFLKCCSFQKEYRLIPSKEWSDDKWFLNQEERKFLNNEGFWLLNEGESDGRLIGGHLSSMNSIQGTEYFPSLDSSVLFIEEIGEVNISSFDKMLQSLLLQNDFNLVKGLLIGRFQKNSKISMELLKKVISSKSELKKIPIVANVDFGHTTPICTLPIGGQVSIRAYSNDIKIDIMKH